MFRNRLPLVWLMTLCLLMGMSAWMIFFSAPVERTMGIVQKIFYIHVPSAFAMFLAFLLSGVGGVVFLMKRNLRADWLSVAGAEVGLLFCTIVLVTGPLWAKPVWGSYWTWEPRLTTTLILWLIFASYFLIRQGLPPAQARVAGAAIAILGCLDIPLIMGAVKLWRGLHPSLLGETGALPPSMARTLAVSAISILSLAATFIVWKYRNAQHRIPDLLQNRREQPKSEARRGPKTGAYIENT